MKIDKNKMNLFMEKVSPKGCPLCGNNKWIIGETVFAVNESYPTSNNDGYLQTYPIIPLTCSVCGNTYFINAFISGIVDMSEKDKQMNEERNTKWQIVDKNK